MAENEINRDEEEVQTITESIQSIWKTSAVSEPQKSRPTLGSRTNSSILLARERSQTEFRHWKKKLNDSVKEAISPSRGRYRSMTALAHMSDERRRALEDMVPTNTKEVIEKLVQTERNYLRDVSVLIKVFKGGFQNSPGFALTEEDTDILFSNIESIYNINVNFLRELEDVRSSEEAASTLIDFSVVLKIYSTYCGNYPEAIESILRLKKKYRENFQGLLDYCSAQPDCKKRSFEYYLSRPTQRYKEYLDFANQLEYFSSENKKEMPKKARQALRETIQAISDCIPKSTKNIQSKRYWKYQISKNHLDFGLQDERCPIYKFINDNIYLSNYGSDDIRFHVLEEGSSSKKMQMWCTPRSVLVPKGTRTKINISLVLKEPGPCKFLIRIVAQTKKKRAGSLLEILKDKGIIEIPTYVTIDLAGLPLSNTLNCITPSELDEAIFMKHIAKGGQGWVDLVEFRGLLYAKKTMVADTEVGDLRLIENEVQAFRRECTIMSNLDHPNIVKIEYICLERFVFLMDYYPLGSLRNVLRDRTFEMSWKLRLKIASDVVSAMIYLSRLEILNRDLKTDNILVKSLTEEEDTIKLTDFGLAKDPRASRTSLTRAPRGTLYYMAPEVIKGEANTEKSDVYSFGIILWELLTRLENPYSDLDEKWNSRFSDAILSGERPVIPTECPPEYATLMSTCWSANPKQRPTFEQIGEALEQIPR